jgi:peptide/nickel transport system substrate-binding protein
VARGVALAAAIAVSLLAVSGTGGADAQTPKRGGTVVIQGRFGGIGEPACLNPYRSCGGFEAVDHVQEVLEGAFERGPDRVRPNLVTGVNFTKKPPFRLTYHIRPEARWSDGVAITARDFVFTHQTIRRLSQPFEIGAPHLNVRTVRRVDAKTVEVTLVSRSRGWRGTDGGLFEVVLPRHALRGEDLESIWTDAIDNPKTGRAIGSGPFLVDRWDRGERLVLRRNPNYWGPHPAYLDRLVMRFDIDEPIEALRSGALDVYQDRLRPELERGFLRIPGMQHLYTPGIRWEHLSIRMIGPGGNPALRSGNNGKLVRQALAYGIDRVALVRGIFGEFVPRVNPADSAVFLQSSPYYEPHWNRYRYRPELARRLLERAGCRRGSDLIYSCAGERLSLRFVTTAGSLIRVPAVELLQRQLRRVGIEVRPTYLPGPVFLGPQFLPSGEWDVALFSYFYGPEDPVDAAFRCGGPTNHTGYCQRLVTHELDQANRILDPVQYARALNRADVQMARDVPVIPLWNDPIAATVRSTIRGFAPMEPLVAWNAENWWLAEPR